MDRSLKLCCLLRKGELPFLRKGGNLLHPISPVLSQREAGTVILRCLSGFGFGSPGGFFISCIYGNGRWWGRFFIFRLG